MYEDGDLENAEYEKCRADLCVELDALWDPERPDAEGPGEILESLGAEWASATLRYQRDMLRLVFKAVCVEPTERWLVCVKPYAQFAPLFRMDGLEEKDGCFYARKEEAETGSTS